MLFLFYSNETFYCIQMIIFKVFLCSSYHLLKYILIIFHILKLLFVYFI